MKYIGFLGLIIFMISGCSQTSEPETRIVEKYKNGNIKTSKVFINGKDTTEFQLIHFEKNGDTSEFLSYKGPRFTGLIKNYENGKLFMKATAEMGFFVNRKVIYDATGNIKQIDSLNGKCELDNCYCPGNITRFFDNGKIKERLYQNDIGFDGLMTIFYENGKIKEKLNYKNDMLHGKREDFDSLEKLTRVINYQNGQKEGKTIEYFDKGVRVEGQYSNDLETGMWYQNIIAQAQKLDKLDMSKGKR